MRRGTRVGQAYVAVTADGSGINEDITESVDAASDDVGASGKRAGRDYGDSFGEEFEGRLDAMFDRVGEKLGKRLGRSLGTSLTKAFNGTGPNSLGERIGATIGSALSDRIEESLAGALDMIEESQQSSGSGSSGVSGNRTSTRLYPTRDPDDAVRIRAMVADEAFDRARMAMLVRAQSMNDAYDHARGLELDRAHAMNDAFDRAQGNMVTRAMAMNDAFDRARMLQLTRAHEMNDRFDEMQRRMIDSAYAMNERYDRDRGLLLDRAYDMNESFDRSQHIMLSRAYDLNERYDRDRHLELDRAHRMNDAFDRARTKMLAEAYRLNLQFNEGRLGGDGRSNGVRGGGDDDGGKRLGDRLGGLLGAGSRNNALNLFGKSLSGIINLSESLGKSVTGLFSKFSTGFNSLEEGSGLLSKIGAGFSEVGASAGAGLSSIAVSGPVAVAAIAAVGGAMVLLVSVAGALLAILTAIVATIASALVGAAAVAVGALGAVGVAAGLVAVAFTSMTDAQSAALKASFQPLKAELTGIGQLMITQIVPYFDVWSRNLQNALLLIAPLASRMGDAFGRAGAILTQAFSGPGFQLLTQQLGVYLPNIVTRLASALGGFLNGSAGIFAALLPQVNRFAGYLADVADRFSKFANSAEGQNKISDFVDRAVVSLQSLWDFTQQAFGAISDIIFSKPAQNAGNSIFDSLSNSLKTFREKINDGTLQKWFDDGIKFGSALKDVLSSIGDVLRALYNSGVLDAINTALKAFASAVSAISTVAGPVVDFLGYILPRAAAVAVAAFAPLISIIALVGQALSAVTGGGFDIGAITTPLYSAIEGLKTAFAAVPQAVAAAGSGPQYNQPIGPGLSNGVSTLNTGSTFNTDDLINSGNTALANTSVDAGGYKPKPTKPAKPAYKNPYVEYANSLIKDGPKIAATIQNAILTVNKQTKAAIDDAAKATSGADVASSFGTLVDSIKTSAKQGVNNAQQALNSAAQSLANASTAKAAKAALKKVKQSQKDVAAAIANQDKINAAAKIVNAQKVVTGTNVDALLKGIQVQNATLADYAEARGRLADTLDKANQKLADAISLRDSYKVQVEQSIQSFGSLLTAQAQSINGVTQALTAGDITSNLKDRLQQIKDFNDDLQVLLAQGLSNDAYKQIVDAGVEQGSVYAQALIEGGIGSVQEVNGLVDQINSVAGDLGTQASSRLYQAGVDAAQGLVDGLTSLSAQLDSAATALGNSIAQAVKNALGIASPSRVMFDMMHDDVGDGVVGGLDATHTKVDKAANRLASRVAISPSLASAYSEGRVPAAVSGNNNDPRFRDLIVHTPTENPQAVAREVLNEVTGRL